MNVCVFYYDGFCEFEVVFAVNQFRDNTVSVAVENRVYISEEKQKFLPDKTIQELNPDDNVENPVSFLLPDFKIYTLYISPGVSPCCRSLSGQLAPFYWKDTIFIF